MNPDPRTQTQKFKKQKKRKEKKKKFQTKRDSQKSDLIHWFVIQSNYLQQYRDKIIHSP